MKKGGIAIAMQEPIRLSALQPMNLFLLQQVFN
jgi:hypothetical protein